MDKISLKRMIQLDDNDNIEKVEEANYSFFNGKNNDLFLEINYYPDNILGKITNYVVRVKDITNFFISESSFNELEKDKNYNLIILGNNINYNFYANSNTTIAIMNKIYNELKEVIKTGKLKEEKQDNKNTIPHETSQSPYANPYVFPQWEEYKKYYDEFNKNKWVVTYTTDNGIESIVNEDNYMKYFDYEDTFEDVLKAASEKKYGLSFVEKIDDNL